MSELLNAAGWCACPTCDRDKTLRPVSDFELDQRTRRAFKDAGFAWQPRADAVAAELERVPDPQPDRRRHMRFFCRFLGHTPSGAGLCIHCGKAAV